MIPKIIHYCWFGEKAKPKRIKKCISTWKKYLPEYNIIEWNESNFDIECNDYVKHAYKDKKYAFVSDVARLKALVSIGGIYLDTDVRLYKSFNEILDNKIVFGFEEKNYIATSFIACEAHNEFLQDFLKYYENAEYGDCITNVMILTNKLEKMGLVRNNTYQIVNNTITIYPKEYFSPYNYIDCNMNKTENTICAHLFFTSWGGTRMRVKRIIKKILFSIIRIGRFNMINKYLGRENEKK